MSLPSKRPLDRMSLSTGNGNGGGGGSRGGVNESSLSAKRVKASTSVATCSVVSDKSIRNNNETNLKATQFKLRRLVKILRGRHTNDEIHSSIDISCPVFCAILDTPQVQRLHNLRQLGTSFHVYMNCNHTRFEHSVGVAHLAGHLCSKIRERQPQLPCTDKDVLCVRLAGLLHDIGHGPFSHTYERFVTKSLPEHLQSLADQKKAQGKDSLSSAEDGDDDDARMEEYLELRKQVPTNWNHEMVSLTMIDSILEHLGLQIDLDNLDQPLKQIGDGIDATSMRVFPPGDQADQETAMDMDSILTSRDFVFIKECIWGGPLPELGGQGFVGRPMMEKEWLYDIVCNRHSGLDVGKMIMMMFIIFLLQTLPPLTGVVYLLLDTILTSCCQIKLIILPVISAMPIVLPEKSITL